MKLAEYFETDDGSLPEVELSFGNPSQVAIAFQHLHDRGAVNVTGGAGMVWCVASQSERPYAGPGDAALVASGEIEPFHVVLEGIRGSDCPIPDLGVYVDPSELTLDYRMGEEWGAPQIESFIELLRQLRLLGGTVSVPWWGDAGARDFRSALDGI